MPDTSASRPRLAFIVTHPTSVNLLRGQLQHLSSRGFDVTLVTAPSGAPAQPVDLGRVRSITVAMDREICLRRDVVAFFRLYRVLRKIKPDIVNFSTPKAGLLGALASLMARVPVRVYTLRGLRLETTSGVRRAILWAAEWVSARCAHRVICVSHSLRTQYLELGLSERDKAIVLGHGSSGGVEIERFAPMLETGPDREAVTESIGIPRKATVIGFVGRITRDKGIPELLQAFEALSRRRPDVWLLVVGNVEQGDRIPARCVRQLWGHPRIVMTGWVTDTAPYYRAIDIVAFPSHREGSPNVPLEAAAAGVPVVGCRVTGTVDAIVDGETGSLVPADDSEGLFRALELYIGSPELRRIHGRNGRVRARRLFARDIVLSAIEREYRSLIRETGIDRRHRDHDPAHPQGSRRDSSQRPASCGSARIVS